MRYTEDIKLAVRASYVYDRHSMKIAAKIHDVPYETGRNWKAASKRLGDDWDKARNAARIAEGGLGDVTNAMLENFALQMPAIMEILRDTDTVPVVDKVQLMSQLADAYSKVISASTRGDSKMSSLAVAMKVITELGDYIREHFPQHSAAFVEVLEPFGQHIAEVLG